MGRKNKKSNKNKTINVITNNNDINENNKQNTTATINILNNNNNIKENNTNNLEIEQNNLENNQNKDEFKLLINKERYNNNNIDKINNKSNIINTATDVERIITELKLKKEENKIVKQENNDDTIQKCRDYYINYLCQVCKNIIVDDNRDDCLKCKMISYCSKEHRQKHWPIHADLCEAIQNTTKLMNKRHILENCNDFINAEQFKNYCYNLMLECQTKVLRKLDEWEIELFLYPKVCDMCYNYNKKELISCKECHHNNFCNIEHQKSNHKKFCNSLVLYRKVIQYQHTNGSIITYFPETHSDKDITLKEDINEILKSSKNILKELEYIQLTESATEPLTAAYSIKLFNKKHNKNIKENFTIHIIGAEKHFELNLLEKWEIFFIHYFSNIKKINLIFIGPEMNINKEEINKLKNIILCENCKKQNRKIESQFYDKTLYHEYINFNKYLKPDLICAFNAGLYRETGYDKEDTWQETIKSMFKIENIPILITAYTSVEIFKDLKRIKKIQKCDEIKMPSQNPFSSLKPNLNFVSYEDTPVIFKNYFLTILKK